MTSTERKPEVSGRHIVITGAGGFLGGYMTAHLAGQGMRVLPVSRRPLPGVRQVRHYTETPAGGMVIHLAEAADRSSVNRVGQKAVRDAAAVVRTLIERFEGRVLYASSATVYGDEHGRPCTVDSPLVCNDAYTEAKALAERAVLHAGGVAVRLCNLIGRGMSEDNVLSDILRQIPGTGPIYVRDDTPVRDFLAVEDAVAAIGLLAETWQSGVFNVGSGIGTSVRELAELCLRAAGEPQRRVVATAPSSRPSRLVLDISQTNRLLGWSPSLTLADQLTQLIALSKDM